MSTVGEKNRNLIIPLPMSVKKFVVSCSVSLVVQARQHAASSGRIQSCPFVSGRSAVTDLRIGFLARPQIMFVSRWPVPESRALWLRCPAELLIRLTGLTSASRERRASFADLVGHAACAEIASPPHEIPPFSRL